MPSAQADYQQRVRKHLAQYKQTRLGIRASGVWSRNGRSYAHILPSELKRLNILETIRAEFFEYQRGTDIKLHRDFQHLNSSQALCFNLFFPFFGLPDSRPAALLNALGATSDRCSSWAFERVPDRKEGTNFDFWVGGPHSSNLYIEVKFTETGFGSTKPDKKHLEKLDTIYRKMLRNKVAAAALQPTVFCKHYQLLRNVAYAGPQRRVVLLVPRANPSLERGLEFVRGVLSSPFDEYVRVVYVEDLLQSLMAEYEGGANIIATHLKLLGEKYLVTT